MLGTESDTPYAIIEVGAILDPICAPNPRSTGSVGYVKMSKMVGGAADERMVDADILCAEGTTER